MKVQINASLGRSECRYDKTVNSAYFSSPFYLGTEDLTRVHGVKDLAAINEDVVSTAGLDHHRLGESNGQTYIRPRQFQRPGDVRYGCPPQCRPDYR